MSKNTFQYALLNALFIIDNTTIKSYNKLCVLCNRNGNVNLKYKITRVSVFSACIPINPKCYIQQSY